jgi:hypothetical protein
MHLFGGDIALNEEEKHQLGWDLLTPSARLTRAVVTLPTRKWANGDIPYELSSNFSE